MNLTGRATQYGSIHNAVEERFPNGHDQGIC